MNPKIKSKSISEKAYTELEDRYKRAVADYQNQSKRYAQEKQSFLKFANITLIENLIPSLEILEKAAFHSPDPGVKMALDKFVQALTSEGLEEIAPSAGNPFDITLNECVETVPGKPDGGVAELVAKGYRFKEGPVIRPAKVKVYKNI